MSETPPLRVLLANPRGFCAGVERAIDIVERALAIHGAPVYVRHEIVHNARVVEGLRAKGAVFVEEVDEIPPGAVTVFSAHGVPARVERAAAARGLSVIDATCPLVAKVHREGQRYAAERRAVILIGHAGHPEVEGTLGQIAAPVHLVATAADVAALDIPADAGVAYVTQTTLSVSDTSRVIEAILARWPDAAGPQTRDICYATQNRQQAVRDMAGRIDLLLVLGAANSSNSTRLAEIGASLGIPSHLVAEAGEIDPAWLDGIATLGVTAGASAPEILVRETIARLGRLRHLSLEEVDGIAEQTRFRLPPGLDHAPQPRQRALS